MHRAFRFSLVFLLAFLPPDTARATSCTVLSGCHPLASQGALFLGEAIDVRNGAFPHGLYPCDVRFRVIESFSPSPRPGEEVEVAAILESGDCKSGSGFKIGQRYLVDAYDSDPGRLKDVRLAAGLCDNTRDESDATLALAELRTRASGGRVPDLNGQVSTIEGIDKLIADGSKPLPNVTVTITSENGATTLHTTTDAAGIYTFPSVPSGPYRVAFDGLPPHRAPMQAAFLDEGPFSVTIPDSGSDGASCHVNAYAAPSGGISGQMVDASGTGVEGVVEAYPADQPRTGPPLPWAAIGAADKQGHFSLHFLHDGDYRIEYSGLTSGKVDRVAVRDGQTTTGVQLRLPTP
jgi:hypothetical protein